MNDQSVDVLHLESTGEDSVEDLQSLLGVEECVRYYPPDLTDVGDPRRVFAPDRQPRPGRLAREIDIFVDVPFCKTICGFCPFNVYPYDAGKVRRYLDALSIEIRHIVALHDFSNVTIGSVWIGGGTPSVMEQEVLDELLTVLHTNFDLSRVHEFTVEIKPTLENLAESKLAMLQRHRVRRISMGVQSTQEEFLRVLGRGHTKQEALEVVSLIKDSGFALNIDMMYRLPGQDLAGVQTDIDEVATLGIDHMSWFPYVPHEGTKLARRIERGRVRSQAGRKAYEAMFGQVSDGLATAGYDQYTPYHFGGPDRCHYHEGRWGLPQRETLGLGPGAFSFFNGWIYTNQHDPERYEATVAGGLPPVQKGKHLDATERITRLAVLGVKLFELEYDIFRVHSGVDLREYYREELALLVELGLVEHRTDRLVCTAAGRAFNNDVATLLATDTARRSHHPQALEFMQASS